MLLELLGNNSILDLKEELTGLALSMHLIFILFHHFIIP